MGLLTSGNFAPIVSTPLFHHLIFTILAYSDILGTIIYLFLVLLPFTYFTLYTLSILVIITLFHLVVSWASQVLFTFQLLWCILLVCLLF